MLDGALAFSTHSIGTVWGPYIRVNFQKSSCSPWIRRRRSAILVDDARE
jgi:hypothetical protein